MRKGSVLLAASVLLLSSANLAVATVDKNDREIKELIHFLISPPMLALSKDSLSVPLSFYVGDLEDITRYFGDYICAPLNTCTVVDTLYEGPFAILGRGLPPEQGTELEWFQAQTQIERTNIKYGTAIYDAATWQIALALAAKYHYLAWDTAKTFIANQLQSISNPGNRAINPLFQYGYQQSITDPTLAFTFRLITTDFYNKDPFFQSRYQNFISWDYEPDKLAKLDPAHSSPDFFKYVTTWSDWQPLTGDNAWAQIIGPLQADYLLYNGSIPITSKALSNAMNSLYAFSAMQTAIGAFYYAPGGTVGAQGLIPEGEISVEDNFSVLAGLQILKRILQNTEQTSEVILARQRIDVMLYGGKTVNGYDTLGLLVFLYNGAFDVKKGLFFTHGTAITPSAIDDWQPDTTDEGSFMSVNVNLWGISALGVETVDRWFGPNTARKIWRIVRNQGGYFNNGQLWGVGFTMDNNIGPIPENIMSTEGTASAINTLNSLIDYYSGKGVDISELEDDLESMEANILHLRNDLYLDSQFFDATPKESFVVVPPDIGQAYLYASRRFPLPWDWNWNANTLAATVANAWVLMNKFDFNPFQYQGKLSGENYSVPAKTDIRNVDNFIEGGALPKRVTVQFTAGDLGAISQLSLSYNLDGSQANWFVASTIGRREGIAFLPKGTQAIAITFFNGGWAMACQVIPASKICKDQECGGVKTIKARWSSDGKGECDLSD
ncbi:Uncharacterised protein [Legionella donaldsonii]|uniref:Uncharacterized protein n=2 Tax=Legionella TaxID=445 RepID=A0A378J6U6_9GAMM|nr:hypothetical protein [Legionella donaldsonii]STX42637.1 Uncharacterised protein [Legionella donaldsonii]